VLCVPDIPADDALVDASTSDADASSEDAPDGSDAGDAGLCADFGCLCEEDDGCATGICLPGVLGGRCTVECAASCPNDWICTPFGEAKPSLCVPP
jgi:hypothetical protein